MTTTQDTVYDYLKHVDEIAEECRAMFPCSNCGHDDRAEWISESVDSSYWIIYYHANETVIQATDNEPDGDEVQAMCEPDVDWRRMRSIAAYLAMERDIYEDLEHADDDAEYECPDC